MSRRDGEDKEVDVTKTTRQQTLDKSCKPCRTRTMDGATSFAEGSLE